MSGNQTLANPAPDLAALASWVDAGALRPLDLALADFVHREGRESDGAVLLAVALVSERNGHGHVCLALDDALRSPERLLSRMRDDHPSSQAIRRQLAGLLRALTLDEWVERLRRCAAVETLWHAAAATETTPLVLAGSPQRPLLYLRRYWQYEQTIRQQLKRRLQQPVALASEPARVLLDQLFGSSGPDDAEQPVDWQKVACALAARSGFAIITGGPGTGKTHTVVSLLALLQGLSLQQGQPPLNIRLAAPTGKAAARLNESIAGKVQGLRLEGITGVDAAVLRAHIPTQVSTLHRLLGALPDSRRFRHHIANPLPADVVVVDEASMVDVEMMALLLDALRPDTRLILLGDKDQLASVEAGAVLGNLCQGASAGHYTPATLAWLRRATGEQVPDRYRDDHGQALYQAMTILRHSYRFSAAGGIGALALLVNEGRVGEQAVPDRLAACRQLFRDSAAGKARGAGSIALLQLSTDRDRAFDELVREGYRDYLAAMREHHPGDEATQSALDDWAASVLQAHGRFQLLTALRAGPWGVASLNRRIEQVLSAAGLQGTTRQWYAGRPVLVTRNDYTLRLMNGDIGIALPVPVEREQSRPQAALRVAFPGSDSAGGVRWILPSRLQSVETVFAMTVHKSQGSEFRHTALVLPDTVSPVLTRELLYTGITRSQERFTLIYSRDEVLEAALSTRVERTSGLSLAEPDPASGRRR